MRLPRKLHSSILCALTFIALCATQNVFAQTTLITHQGKLEFDGVPASGNYDFQFRVFNAASGGAQQGVHDEQLNVTVTNGAYTVMIDFGTTPFINSSADRFLEVSVRVTGSTTYTALTPRQQITTTPYSIRSIVANRALTLDLTCVGCVTSGQIQNVQGSQVIGNVTGSQIFGMIPVASVPAGSNNYIQNTVSPQPNVNFNISGSGFAGGMLSANLVNATSQYLLGTTRVLGYTASNLAVGLNAGNTIATGFFNVSVGNSAGNATTTGSENNFFGLQAGQNNTTGSYNSFFGASAGVKNTAGNYNSFFGRTAGSNNTGSENSFFGFNAGFGNTTGLDNSFFGAATGYSNTVGVENSFFGTNAGSSNTAGARNTFVGTSAGLNNTTGSFNTFIGNRADFNSINPTGDNNALFGYNTGVNSGVSNATAIGAGAQATASNTVVLGTKLETVIVRGKLLVDMIGIGGTQPLCLNNHHSLSSCSSSLRYKTDLLPFTGGLSLINRLQPLTFTWKDGGMRDLGFGAEDVHKIEPLLVTYNADGQVEGVKYDRISAVLVNALKEQQQQIAAQQIQIEELTAIKSDNAELRAKLADVIARLNQIEKACAGRK